MKEYFPRSSRMYKAAIMEVIRQLVYMRQGFFWLFKTILRIIKGTIRVSVYIYSCRFQRDVLSSWCCFNDYVTSTVIIYTGRAETNQSHITSDEVSSGAFDHHVLPQLQHGRGA